jgi:parallel beta-helix repeat protein
MSTISYCTFDGNSAASYAGGICLFYGSMEITNCTFSGNSANIAGGISQSYGTTYLTNCTLANNSVTYADYGGGMYQDGGTIYVKNCILGNNTGEGSASDYRMDSGTLVDNGYNIVESSSGYTWSGTGDITGDQPNLNVSATLADNGTLFGTQTLALSSGSVAIDAGKVGTNGDVAVPTIDQRGYDRSDPPDIGAYEYGAEPTATPTSTPTGTPTNTPTPTPTNTPSNMPTPTPTLSPTDVSIEIDRQEAEPGDTIKAYGYIPSIPAGRKVDVYNLILEPERGGTRSAVARRAYSVTRSGAWVQGIYPRVTNVRLPNGWTGTLFDHRVCSGAREGVYTSVLLVMPAGVSPSLKNAIGYDMKGCRIIY